MKFSILVVAIVAALVVGPWSATTSPPQELTEERHRVVRSPKPALPAAVVPIAIAVASNPILKKTVVQGAGVFRTVGQSLARHLGSAFEFSKKHLTSFGEKFKSTKADKVADAVEVTALVPVSGALTPSLSADSLGADQDVSGGPKKKGFWSKVGNGALKATEITAQASNVAVSVAGVVQVAQLNAAQQASQVSVSSDQSCSIPTPSITAPCILSSQSTNGGFSLDPYIKIVWHDKSSTCRESILNLADGRTGFPQSLPQFSAQTNLNFKLHSHQLAAINCAAKKALPKTIITPHFVRESKPVRTAEIPLSNASGKKMLAWKGLNWFTPLIVNSCVLDSFLTHMALKGKLDSTYTKRNFLIPQNPGEAVIAEIIRQFRKLPFNTSPANQKIANQNWKQLWIKTFEPKFTEDLRKGSVIDYKGIEFENVIEKLVPSATIFETQSCRCKENNAEKIRVKSFYMKSLDLAELQHLSRQSSTDHSKSLSHPLFAGWTKETKKTCSTCTGDYKIDYIFLPGSTWLVYFIFKRSSHQVNFDVSLVPKTFAAHELFSYEKVVLLELGYITCKTTTAVGGVTHQLSFQYFNRQFYYYDDLKGGELLWSPNPTLTIKAKKLKCDAVTYFRP